MFKVGQEVRAIDSHLEGVIIEVKDINLFVLKDEHGFEHDVFANEIILNQSLEIPNTIHIKDEKLKKETNFIAPSVIKGAWLIDLHAHELPISDDYPKNKILLYQLEYAKNSLDKARRSGRKRLILVHGVGEGILRAELYKLLKAQPRVNFFDANYKEFGIGATEVELY